MDRLASHLRKYGVVTIPVFDARSRAEWETKVWSAMDEFPEYRVQGRTVQRVLGGFGALGNPSSFHHPTIQALRNHVKQTVSIPLFRRYNHRERKLEVLFDRLCVRSSDFGDVTKESWHRDIYDGEKFGLRNLPGDDEIFGGWINLSDRSQRFVGIAKSHKGADAKAAQRMGGGFSQLTEAQIRDQAVLERLARQAGRRIGSVVADDEGHLLVPPGHMIVFFQRLLHSVAGGKQPKEPQLRLFFGHRLTHESTPLFPLEEVLTNNAVPRIPSGQVPPMYSQNHYAFFSKTPRYRDWAHKTFKRQCLFQRTTPKGDAYFTPGSADDRDPNANRQRTMPSLAAMGFAPYQYSTGSRATLTPETVDDYGWGADEDVVDAATDED